MSFLFLLFADAAPNSYILFFCVVWSGPILLPLFFSLKKIPAFYLRPGPLRCLAGDNGSERSEVLVKDALVSDDDLGRKPRH